jgi:hypothetical protein
VLGFNRGGIRGRRIKEVWFECGKWNCVFPLLEYFESGKFGKNAPQVMDTIWCVLSRI